MGRLPAEVIRKAAVSLEVLGSNLQLSPLYRSPAWPDPSEPEYRNAVAMLETRHSPRALLAALQAIEAGFGRTRSDRPTERYAPRTLDLDLLAVGHVQLSDERLTLPHPAIADRDFVLLPLKDVAPAWRHPATNLSADQMIRALEKTTATLAP